jgi:hypothetical protein
LGDLHDEWRKSDTYFSVGNMPNLKANPPGMHSDGAYRYSGTPWTDNRIKYDTNLAAATNKTELDKFRAAILADVTRLEKGILYEKGGEVAVNKPWDRIAPSTHV